MAREDAEPASTPEQTVPDEASRLFAATADEVLASTRIPLATYRVQLNAGFRFTDAAQLVPYLERLGITDLYASPYLRATPGSPHGYDVIDHQSLNPEIGTFEEHEALCRALREHGLGQILDFVPNHMGIERGNRLWNDVLENGPASLCAKFFDIDWDPVKVELQNKVLLPILGDQYGEVLERGELKVRFERGTFWVDYYDRALPVSVRQYAIVLRDRLAELEARLGSGHPDLLELQSILTAIEHLPRRTESAPEKMAERSREKEIIKRRLGVLTEQNAQLAAFVAQTVGEINGQVGEPRSFDTLDRLLSDCCYRVAHWRVAGEEINYRRFFDINTLAAIRVEDPEVFDEAHALVFRLLDEGKVTGLRIDHPDGLFDPTAYFLRLQEEFFIRRARRIATGQGMEASWPALETQLRSHYRARFQLDPTAPLFRALYVLVEKIQGGRERIPEAWAVHGTTGYRYANMVTDLLIDPDAEHSLSRLYARFTGQHVPFRELVYEKKKLVLNASMSSEINVLARELSRIAENNRSSRDFTLGTLRRALIEFIALFPVYRTYLDGWRPEIDERDVRYIEWTIRRAKEKDPTTNVSVYDFLGRILLRRYSERVPLEERAQMLTFAMKLQQLTGPVMAKGLEDTAFYIYNRMACLNEVGGEPERFGTSVAAFHLRNQERAENWPGALLASSTHDTKRSEDVRARLAVLSEVPAEWADRVRRWARLNRRYKIGWGEGWAPTANDEYLFYQTVIGAWPMGERLSEAELGAFRSRISEYMLKAIREAKVNTSWLNPDADYEAATARFIEQTLTQPRFVEEAWAFKRRIERAGQVNALSQVLLKIASPGTTDVYQGCELWELSLVDPDNRRPVDFARRIDVLDELERRGGVDRLGLCAELFQQMDDGRVKMFVLTEGLRLRRRKRRLFRRGAYLPLDVAGPHASCAIAFARRDEDDWILAVAPRLVAEVIDSGWPAALADTHVQVPEALENAELVDVFTGQSLRPERQGSSQLTLELTDLWRRLPVALLEKKTT